MKTGWLILAMLMATAMARAFGPDGTSLSASAAPAGATDTPTFTLNATLWKAPANETRNFAAAQVGKAGASETMAQLKQLYAAAAAEYRLVNGVLTEWDAEAQAKYAPQAAGQAEGMLDQLLGKVAATPADVQPLSWEMFGVFLKSGRAIIVRVVESRIATPGNEPSHFSAYASHSPASSSSLGAVAREPWIIDYTVTWQAAKK